LTKTGASQRDASEQLAKHSYVVSKAIEQQISYGLTAEKFVPRIPGKMHLPK